MRYGRRALLVGVWLAAPRPAHAQHAGTDAGTDAGSDAGTDAGTGAGTAGEAVVRAQAPPAAAGSYALPVGALAGVPRQNAGELLTLAPGVRLENEGGVEGHAYAVSLRGFLGDDGSDTELTLDGVPLNDESNPHSHGYADLFFVLPELVERVDVVEGVASARQGNYAVAGSINLHLALPDRGTTVRAIAGSYGYRRLAVLYGPAQASDDTFVATEAVHSDGYGPARTTDRASGLAQYAWDLGAAVRARLLVGAYASRFTTPGVVREDDYDAGRAGFFDTYAGAGAQGGASSRALVSAAVAWRGARQRLDASVWGQVRSLEIRENLTGFAAHPDAGDLDGQRYAGGSVGAGGSYHREVRVGGLAQELEVGLSLRHDRYAVSDHVLAAATGRALATPDPQDQDAAVRATDVGLYAEALARPVRALRLRAGLRVDAVAYAVDATVFDPAAGRPGPAHQDVAGAHAGPKAAVELALGRGFSLEGSAGTGFRTAGALDLAALAAAPFATAATEDLGVRFVLPAAPGRALRAMAAVTGFHTYVSSDLLFDATRDMTVPAGPTRRLGVALWARVQPLPGVDVMASVVYTRATLENAALEGTVAAGSALPFVAPWVARLDAAAERGAGALWGSALRVRGGVGASYYGVRPLPLGLETEPVVLLDASVGARLGRVGLDLAARNLLDARWRDASWVYASSFTPGSAGAPGAALPVRHFTAGAPRTLFATLSLYVP